MLGMLGSLIGGRGGRMLGGMIGGRHGAMVGGLLGAVVGGRRMGRGGSGLGSALSKLKGGGDDDGDAGDSLTDGDAELIIRAMANSAKADGHVDQAEIDQILGELGDASRDEQDFLRNELSAPFVPAASFAQAIPEEISANVYIASLMAIEVDDGKEVSYLKELASSLGISEDDRDSIHDQLELPIL